jgi:15-cis-phytoene synthase
VQTDFEISMGATLPSSIKQIVDRSGSNLAFALAPLPTVRREDMQRFYAYCRVVDDIVDEPGIPREERESGLDYWQAVITEAQPAVGDLETGILQLKSRYGVPEADLLGILDGMRMDLDPPKYQTQQDLDAYCYRVACLVGLVSIRIFGCQAAESVWYAESLGMALQLTNVLRDVGADAAMGRIYLPAELLDKYGVSAQSILQQHHTPGLARALAELAGLAETYFLQAKAHRTPEDKGKLVAAEAMRRIYSRVLRKMQADGYRVFAKRYRLSKLHKLALLGAAFAGK